MAAHPEIPLVALGYRVHLRVPFTLLVFGGTGRVDDRDNGRRRRGSRSCVGAGGSTLLFLPLSDEVIRISDRLY